jgi:hypothetical protein
LRARLAKARRFCSRLKHGVGLMNDAIDIRLSAQRALWGSVPRSLRAFSVEIIGNIIRVRSVFDETATDEDKMLLSEAGTEIVADYPSPFKISEEFIVVPVSNKPEHLRTLIYLRHEPQQTVPADRRQDAAPAER